MRYKSRRNGQQKRQLQEDWQKLLQRHGLQSAPPKRKVFRPKETAPPDPRTAVAQGTSREEFLDRLRRLGPPENLRERKQRDYELEDRLDLALRDEIARERARDRPIAPSYNKGPYQPVSAEDLKDGIGRKQ